MVEINKDSKTFKDSIWNVYQIQYWNTFMLMLTLSSMKKNRLEKRNGRPTWKNKVLLEGDFIGLYKSTYLSKNTWKYFIIRLIIAMSFWTGFRNFETDGLRINDVKYNYVPEVTQGLVG